MSKNCSPTIKNNIIQFLSNFKFENYDTELPNIEIFDNHFNNTYNYSENIIFKLRDYIITENDYIDWRIKTNLDKQYGINNNLCNTCQVFCGSTHQYAIHKLTPEHLIKKINSLKHKYNNLESKYNKVFGLKCNKDIRNIELSRQIKQFEYNINDLSIQNNNLSIQNKKLSTQYNILKNKYVKLVNNSN